MDYEQFVRDKISALRERKGVSEYKMSYDLGKSRSYMNRISSGKCLPHLKELFNMMEYFGTTPAEFFEEEPRFFVQQAVNGMNRLKDEDIEVVLSMIGRLCVMREAIEDLARSKAEPLKKGARKFTVKVGDT